MNPSPNPDEPRKEQPAQDDEQDKNAVADMADAIGSGIDPLGGGADVAGSVLEGAGGCLDGCAGCSLAVLAGFLLTAQAAFAVFR